MKFELVLSAAALLLTAMPNIVSANAIFHAANPGDGFSGTFNLNPATPVDPSYTNASQSIYSAPIGVFSAQIGADVFSSSINGVYVVPGSDVTTWRWYLNGFSITNQQLTISFNGVDIFGTMSIQLYGSSPSISILPSTFDSYTRGTFQIQAATLDQSSTAVYLGEINSLVQINSSADFAFGGSISESNLWPAAPVPLGHSPWLTMILGLIGLGFIAYRRRSQSVALAA